MSGRGGSPARGANPVRGGSPGGGFRGLQEEEDGEVYINLELPQGKVDDFLKQLQAGQSAFKDSFPLAHTASLEALAAPSGRKGDTIIPQPMPTFDPIEKLSRLRELQERYSVITEQRVKAERAKMIFDQLPFAGESTVMPPPAPADSIGSTFGMGAPATVPPPFPPAGGLPFPYGGVPGVIAPRAKPPPELPVDIAGGDHWVENEQAVDEAQGAGSLPKPETLFVKDGLDMSFHQLRSHGQRMQQNVKEMDRRLTEAKEYSEMKDLRAAPEAMDQYLRQQRIIHEQGRKTDELQMDVRMEEERQFWVARDQRQSAHRKAYGDRFYGFPQEEVVEERYDHTPSQLLLAGQRPNLDMSRAEMIGRSDARRDKSVAMEYVSAPDTYSEFNPMSHYAEESMPTQAFRKNLIQEAAYKEWPPAVCWEPGQDEPEGEASVGSKKRRSRKVNHAPVGQGVSIGGGGRSSQALPPNFEAPPAEDAPESAAAFFAGWR